MVNKGEELIDLPPGFRFHPTDEEIITCYLTEKVVNSNFSASAIGEADLNKCEPWDLPSKFFLLLLSFIICMLHIYIYILFSNLLETTGDISGMLYIYIHVKDYIYIYIYIC